MFKEFLGRIRHLGLSCAASLVLALPIVASPPAVAQDLTPTQVPQPSPVLTPEAARVAIQKGESTKYECAYVHPKNEPLPFSTFCPETTSEGVGPAREGRVLSPDNGDIVVVLKATQYLAAMKAMKSTPQLSINGVSMGGSARLTGTFQNDKYVKLNFSVTQVGLEDSLAFWATLYQRVGFSRVTPMYVTLGWPENPNYFQPNLGDGIPDGLYITSRTRLVVASLLGLFVVAGFVLALRRSDIFRIGPRLVTGERQAYSFARVQWGVWTTFTVASAVFLWAVYGILLPLSDQMLAVAGVSTLAATTSFFMDANRPTVPWRSANLWQDLLSGSNDSTAQAHRFQALVVNVVLLVASAYFVYKHLGYPTFDPTWLAMLGLSNAAQLAGKQAIETVSGGTPGSGIADATVPAGPPAGQIPVPAPVAAPPATVPVGPPGGLTPPQVAQGLASPVVPVGPPADATPPSRSP